VRHDSLGIFRKGIMVELTRRRESKHPPPHQASCERCFRRSRPTNLIRVSLLFHESDGLFGALSNGWPAAVARDQHSS